MSERPPVPLAREEVLALFGLAVQREDFERADQLADLLLAVNDPEEADA